MKTIHDQFMAANDKFVTTHNFLTTHEQFKTTNDQFITPKHHFMKTYDWNICDVAIPRFSEWLVADEERHWVITIVLILLLCM